MDHRCFVLRITEMDHHCVVLRIKEMDHCFLLRITGMNHHCFVLRITEIDHHCFVLRITESDHCFVLFTFRDIEDSLTDELHIYVNDEDHQSDVKQEKHSAVVKQ